MSFVHAFDDGAAYVRRGRYCIVRHSSVAEGFAFDADLRHLGVKLADVASIVAEDSYGDSYIVMEIPAEKCKQCRGKWKALAKRRKS